MKDPESGECARVIVQYADNTNLCPAIARNLAFEKAIVKVLNVNLQKKKLTNFRIS
jgi:hypothetical protein